MKRYIAQKWYDALRSGKYNQHDGSLMGSSLNDEDEEVIGFCCLGVLCDLYKGKNKEIKKSLLIDNMPIDAVYKWSGLDEKYAEQLAKYNDNGKSFKQISHYIKQKYLKD